jgi:hypothetical protein
LLLHEKLKHKIKLIYNKKVVNPNFENNKYLFVLTRIKKRINISKIRTSSHEVHSANGCWQIPKTPWKEGICHICDTKRVEDEKLILLECLVYTNIRCQFQNNCHNSHLPNLLSNQNFSYFGMFILMLSKHSTNISKIFE